MAASQNSNDGRLRGRTKAWLEVLHRKLLEQLFSLLHGEA